MLKNKEISNMVIGNKNVESFNIKGGGNLFNVIEEVTGISCRGVRIIWDDDNNSAGLRPKSVLAVSNTTGESFILNDINDWSYTSDIKHSWRITNVLEYKQTNITISNDIFALTLSFQGLIINGDDDDYIIPK